MSLLDRIERGSSRTRKPGELSMRELNRVVRQRVYASISPAEILNAIGINPTQVCRELRDMILRIIDEEGFLVAKAERENAVNSVLNEILGFGPIEPLLNDPTVTEVMVNGPYQVYIERAGKLEETDVTFEDSDHVMKIIDKIVAPLGRRVDESSPMVNARLPDGSRVNAIIPPLALNGPTLTIRKFRTKIFSLEELIDFGSISKEMGELFETCVKARLNIIVSGGTGSGKTTLLNALSSLIPVSERIVTVEDAAELRFNQPHVVSLESRPANIEGKGQVAIRDLVINSLRMRPDRIVVGEVRGGEALDMLQAMNTGHDGSLTTVHANSPREVISRLETMVLMAGMELPVQAIREQIVGAVDVMIHQSRMQDGSRKITQVTEVTGMEQGEIILKDIFTYKQKGLDSEGKVVGSWAHTGYMPTFLERFEALTLPMPAVFKEAKKRKNS